eukprot:Skav202175  [mRNA]  locus=scaffold482:136944:141335:+ [translate_table: standard]
MLFWHKQTKYHVVHRNESHPIPTRRGIRQGCPAAPLLWTAFVHLCLTKMQRHIPLTWIKHHLTIFADDFHMAGVINEWNDILLFFHAVDILVTTLRELGMSVSASKSTAMVALRGKHTRRFQAQFVKRAADRRLLCIPTKSGTTLDIPMTSQTTYLGHILSYTNSVTATVQHRIQLAKTAFRRLQFWLRKRSGIALHDRFSLWIKTVFAVMHYGLALQPLEQKHFWQLHTTMLTMFRQMLGDHSYITRHTHQQVLEQFHIPEPLHLLHRHFRSLLDSLQARHQWLAPTDITADSSWNFVTSNILQAEHFQLQFMHTSIDLSSPQISPHQRYLCPHCQRSCIGLANLRRHVTTFHADAPTRACQVSPMIHAKEGLPICRHCQTSFSSWRAFRLHVQCHACIGITLTPSWMHVQDSQMPLDNLLSQPFGAALLQALKQDNWTQIAQMPEACLFLQTRCILCDKWMDRYQSMSFHLKTEHTCLTSRVLARAAMLQQVLCHSRCQFCGATYNKSHACPVILQCALILAHGYADDQCDPDGDWPSNKRCSVCHESFSDFRTLMKHLATAHQLPRQDYNLSRDSLRGSPTCSHCLTMFETMEGLRSHHLDGRCPDFDPDRSSEPLPIPEDIQQRLMAGDIAGILADPDACKSLTTTCLHCDCTYNRAGDCLAHFMTNHSRLWQPALHYLILLQKHHQKSCVCVPRVKHMTSDHMCLPLINLALMLERLQTVSYVPFVTTDMDLTWIHSSFDADVVDSIRTLLHQRDFAELWNHDAITTALANRCLLCGESVMPCLLRQHFQTVHHPDLTQFQTQTAHFIDPIMMQHVSPQQCNLCGQYLNSPDATMSDPTAVTMLETHLRHLCPVTLQCCLLVLPCPHAELHGDSGSGRHGDAGCLSADGPSLPKHRVQKTPGALHRRGRRKASKAPDSHAAPHGESSDSTRQGDLHAKNRGQLHMFFGQKRQRHTSVDDADGQQVAPAERALLAIEDIPGPTCDGATAGTTEDHLTDGPEGPTSPADGPERCPTSGWGLAIPGLGSPGQVSSTRDQTSSEYAGYDSTRGCIERIGATCDQHPPVSILEDGSQGHSDSLASSGQWAMRRTARPLDQIDIECHLAGAGNDSQGTHPEHHPHGCPTPRVNEGTEGQTQRSWEGQTQQHAEDILTSAQVDTMRRRVLKVSLQNFNNCCYVNASWFAYVWAILGRDQVSKSDFGVLYNSIVQILDAQSSVLLAECPSFDTLIHAWLQTPHDDIQHDVSEFLQCYLSHGGCTTHCADFTWEARRETDGVTVVRDLSHQHMPLHLHLPHAPSANLQTLFEAWSDEDGALRAFHSSTDLLCIHVERHYMERNQIMLNRCNVYLPETILIPFFLEGLERSWRPFTPIALMYYKGSGSRGHWQSFLASQSGLFGHPGFLTEDNQQAMHVHREALGPEHLLDTLWLINKHGDQIADVDISANPIATTDPYLAMQQLFGS